MRRSNSVAATVAILALLVGGTPAVAGAGERNRADAAEETKEAL